MLLLVVLQKDCVVFLSLILVDIFHERECRSLMIALSRVAHESALTGLHFPAVLTTPILVDVKADWLVELVFR